MPTPKSKDEGKRHAMVDASTSKEGKSTSSAIAEKIISRKPESSSSTNKVPSGAKVFSSFQVGKQHPKEEEYLAALNLFRVICIHSFIPFIHDRERGVPCTKAVLCMRSKEGLDHRV
ncbi:hypothetical protein H5410_023307 [Solanum commersonii]|uniref:Uncharacterized protein n=1 Tax=Solanum commersonii TaxID=4109 RepID=A0A9J5ZH73_SOLCO|nr:hypothetical protein H5410_023307 [Solanum commersonii]